MSEAGAKPSVGRSAGAAGTSARATNLLAAGDGAEDEKGFCSGGDRFG